MKKILIANRGEIARRIIRTAHKMGIQTVAVFSEADRDALFVREAGEAICIGPAPSKDSYLDIDKIISAAKATHADAIHPGYGFLSERESFSQAVADAGLCFIGPSPYSIRLMGDKMASKECARKMEVPMLPGSENSISDLQAARELAMQIKLPVIIKASAGGGGKGMRIVHDYGDLEENIRMASSEALSAFGDGAVFIEKYLQAPKHIEIQIMADMHGNICYLFERECSIQRRYQKVIEEAPSPSLDQELRAKIGETAVRIARSCDYTGAGTVEFLLDESKQFYFMEMNTRLQVEHPVTEMITGLDLVELQIRISRGEKLPFDQAQLSYKGHAIEARVNAEDPENDFMPSVGVLTEYEIPVGERVRVDDAYMKNQEIPIYYDSMIGKLIVHARDRIEAIEKMKMAIKKYRIEGVQTILPYTEFILNHEQFVQGNMTTKFVEATWHEFKSVNYVEIEEEAASLVALRYFLDHLQEVKVADTTNNSWSHQRNRKR